MPMPPPPPPGGLALGDSRKTNFKPNPSADGRGLLLDSIRKGTKLKKTETVDKSAPVLGNVIQILYTCKYNIIIAKALQDFLLRYASEELYTLT